MAIVHPTVPSLEVKFFLVFTGIFRVLDLYYKGGMGNLNYEFVFLSKAN